MSDFHLVGMRSLTFASKECEVSHKGLKTAALIIEIHFGSRDTRNIEIVTKGTTGNQYQWQIHYTSDQRRQHCFV